MPHNSLRNMATFRKAERLCSRTTIEDLFHEGHRITVFPFTARWMWMKQPTDQRAVVLIGAPKRYLHHAVDRNRAKRKMRECYRLEKQVLHAAVPTGKTVALSIYHIHKSILPHTRFSAKFSLLLETIVTQIQQDTES